MPNTIYKKRLRVRKNVDSPWIDIPAIVSTPGGIDPVDKTSAMTQPVGRDADGKLWTAPGGGGGDGSMAFVAFEIDSDGNLVINHAERLGSTSFRLTAAGNLEVELNGSN